MSIDNTIQEKTQDPVLVRPPGLYRDVSFDQYSEWDAVNASRLNGFMRTPAHVYYEMLHGGKGPTKALDLGWFVHVAVLEPKRFDEDYIAAPTVERRSKRGKAIWAKFQAANAGKELIEAKSYEKIKAMAASVLAHETAGPFFSKLGHSEISILWEDKEHGIRCKARIDRIGMIGEWPIVGDLKTARSAARRNFERAIYDYGYDVKAVHYLSGLDSLYPIPNGTAFRRFVFIVVESEPPYLCACYELDDSALEEGLLKRNRYLRTWRKCIETGVWEGYAPGIDYASLPPWAFKINTEA